MDTEENPENSNKIEETGEFTTPVKNARPRTQLPHSAGFQTFGESSENKQYSSKSNRLASLQVSSIKEEVNSDNLQNEEIFKTLRQNALLMQFQEEIRMIQAETESEERLKIDSGPGSEKLEAAELEKRDLDKNERSFEEMQPSDTRERQPDKEEQENMQEPQEISIAGVREKSCANEAAQKRLEPKGEAMVEENLELGKACFPESFVRTDHQIVPEHQDESREARRNPEMNMEMNPTINTGKENEKDYKDELFHPVEIYEHHSEKPNTFLNEQKFTQYNTEPNTLSRIVQKTSENVKKLHTGVIENTTSEKGDISNSSHFQDEFNKFPGASENLCNAQTKEPVLKKESSVSDDAIEVEEGSKENGVAQRITKLAAGVTQIHSEQAPNFVTALRKHLYLDLLGCSYSSGKCELLSSEGESKGSLQLHSSSVIDMNWMLDSYILSCNEVECSLFDVAAEKKVRNFRVHLDPIYVVKPLFGSYLFASASCDKTVVLWDLRDSKPINAFLAHTQDITALDFSLNGSLLATCSEDSFCKIWSLFKSCCYRTLNLDKNVPLTSCCFSRNNDYVLLSSLNSEISLWDWKQSEKVRSLKDHRNENHMIESHLGLIEDKENFVLSGSEDGFLFAWNIESESVVLKKDLRSFCTNSLKDQDYVVKFVQMGDQLNPLQRIFVNFMESSDILCLETEFLEDLGQKIEYDTVM